MKLVLALGVILSLSGAHTALSEELADSGSMVHRNDSLKHWNNEPRLIAQLGHATGVSYAAFSPDGKMVVTAGHDSVAILWEFTSGRVLRKFVGHDGDINSVVFSPGPRKRCLSKVPAATPETVVSKKACSINSL